VTGVKYSFYSWNYYHYYNPFTALYLGLSGWAGTRRNIHPLTYPDHHRMGDWDVLDIWNV